MSATNNFQVGDLVQYGERLCVLTNIVPTHLGFRTFTISEVDTGQTFNVAKHLLEQVDLLGLDEPINFDIQNNASVSDTNVANPSTSRHVVCSEEEIVQVARKRLSAKTEAQTKWAVSLFKGECMICYYKCIYRFNSEEKYQLHT
jgi:hypothetical protein